VIGRLVPNLPGFARRVGMAPSEGAALPTPGRQVEVVHADRASSPDAADAQWI
jgi:hypothetical protein